MRNRFKGLDLIDRVPDELWISGRCFAPFVRTGFLYHTKTPRETQSKALVFFRERKRGSRPAQRVRILVDGEPVAGSVAGVDLAAALAPADL